MAASTYRTDARPNLGAHRKALDARSLADSYDRSAPGYDERFRELQRVKHDILLRALAALGRPVVASAGDGALTTTLSPPRAPGGGPAASLGERGTGRKGRILDLGAGTGLLAESLSGDHVITRLVAFDRSFRMVSIARSRVAAAVQGDAACLPFRDASFAGVFAVTVLRIYPDPELETRTIAEIARVLAPEAFVALSVLRDAYDAGLPAGLLRARLAPLGGPLDCGQDLALIAVKRGRDG